MAATAWEHSKGDKGHQCSLLSLSFCLYLPFGATIGFSDYKSSPDTYFLLDKISVEIVAETPGPDCMGRQPINYRPEWQRGTFAKCKAEEEDTHWLIHAYSPYYTLPLGRTALRTQPPHCQAPANSQICLRLSESRCPCRHGSFALLFAQSIWKRSFQWGTPLVKHSNDIAAALMFCLKKQILTADTIGLNYWYKSRKSTSPT